VIENKRIRSIASILDIVSAGRLVALRNDRESPN
jgi:hypothetical protein